MPTVPTTVLDPDEGHETLAALELPGAVLREALRTGYEQADTCTDHDPRSLPGTLVWGKGTGFLRDELKPHGWTADSELNFETVVHPRGSHAVALSAGTADTGRRDGTPRTRRPKGPATSRAVEHNRQLSFAGAHPAFGDPQLEHAARETWLLLHYYDDEAEEIRCELSRPAEMKGKQVTGWSARIILEPVPFSTDLEIDMDAAGDVEVDVDIARRVE